MEIYFVRHGLVDYTTGQLSYKGIDFSKRLPSLIPDKVDFIGCDNEQRCKETILHLEIKNGIKAKNYAKSDFANKIPLDDCPKDGTSIICYRMETINYLLNKLQIPLFTQQNRNTGYEFIIHFKKNNKTQTYNYINTGFKK